MTTSEALAALRITLHDVRRGSVLRTEGELSNPQDLERVTSACRALGIRTELDSDNGNLVVDDIGGLLEQRREAVARGDLDDFVELGGNLEELRREAVEAGDLETVAIIDAR
jgi:hypothetical protein